jgi:hypothetical protein
MDGAQADIEARIGNLFDDADFMSFNKWISPLNVFEAVGAMRSELRHSNFLAYLLSPSRPHGLGTRPLLAVLRSILAGLPADRRTISTLELLAGELDDAIIYRERGNIDVLVVLPSLMLVVAIENKVDAKASDGQLERYSAYLKREFAEYRRLLVFLTPEGSEPDHDEYAVYDYERLADTLETLLSSGADVPADTGLLIRHYVEMVRRHIVQDEKLRKLGQQLYERHKEAFEFIFACRPEPLSLLASIRPIVLGVEGLVEDSSGANVLRFAPAAWDQRLKVIVGDPNKWSKTGRGLLFEVKTYPAAPGRVNLSLIIGPCVAPIREAIYNYALARPHIFPGVVKPMGAKWATIFSRDLLTAAQASQLSFEAQTTNAALAWSDFQASQLPALITSILSLDVELASPTQGQISA